jgi:hypothetical protein
MRRGDRGRRRIRHQHGPLDAVGQLADVARPAVGEQRRPRRRLEAGERLAVARGVVRQKVVGQRLEVLGALAQRRQVDDHGVQAVQQVLAKAPGRDLGRQVGVGRGQHADVDVAQPRRADPLDLAGLQHPQQLGLEPRRHVRDLVQEQRPVVGQLETADPVEPRVGERPLDVPEELALGNPLGQATCVHRYERAPFSFRARVQPRGDDFLARAVLAGDQHGRVRRRDPLDRLPHRPQRRRVADEGRCCPLLQTGIGFLESLAPAHREAEGDLGSHRRTQALVVPRLLDVVASAPAHRLDGAWNAAPGGHDEQGQCRIQGADPLHQVQSLLAGRRVARVVQVENGQVEVGRLEAFDRLARGARGRHVIPLVAQQELEGVEHVRLIVGDEDARGLRICHGLRRVPAGSKVRCVPGWPAPTIVVGRPSKRARRLHSSHRPSRGRDRSVARAGR